MSIFGKIFGSKKAVETLSSGIYNGLDKVAFTNEEKADYFKDLLKLYEPYKIAQRLLACIFCIPYMLAWFITWGASFFGLTVADQKEMLSGEIAYIVGIIAAFYFGGGAINIVKSKLGGGK